MNPRDELKEEIKMCVQTNNRDRLLKLSNKEKLYLYDISLFEDMVLLAKEHKSYEVEGLLLAHIVAVKRFKNYGRPWPSFGKRMTKCYR